VVSGCIKCSDFCLRVGECGGSAGSTQGRASRRFLGDRGIPSSEPRASRNVVEAFRLSFRLVPSQSFWHGFLRGLFFLIVDYGYPLFWYPTHSYSLSALHPLSNAILTMPKQFNL
jgi:hypothetical protein